MSSSRWAICYAAPAMASLAAHYRGKTVLVTGHTGFKGGWLAAWLHKMGAHVVGLSLPPDQDPSLFTLANIADRITHVECDIRDLDGVSRSLATHRPEIVFHLAAQALVRRSYQSPVDTFATNVLGTVHVLEACRQTPTVRSVVVVTSDKCYENRASLWPFRESEPLGGHDPYSASKGCAEIVTSAYRDAFFQAAGIALASGRAGNVIGGGDWSEDRLLPDIVRGAVRGTTTTIRNPEATRPWQHVLEPLSGYLLLGKRLCESPREFAGPWNFGPRDDEPVPARALAERFVSRLGRGTLEMARPDPTAPHEAATLRLDSSKARQLLGWRPLLSLDEAVALTADWYASWLSDSSSAGPMLERQIGEYAARAGHG